MAPCTFPIAASGVEKYWLLKKYDRANARKTEAITASDIPV
jgi:hypothetical protein